MELVVGCLREGVVRPHHESLSWLIEYEAFDTLGRRPAHVAVGEAGLIRGDQVPDALVEVSDAGFDGTAQERLFDSRIVTGAGFGFQIRVGKEEGWEVLEQLA